MLLTPTLLSHVLNECVFLQTSILLKPNFRSALFNLALLLSDSGRPLEAVPFLKQLVDHHPDHIKGLILLGDIYINTMKDLEAAEIVNNIILSSCSWATNVLSAVLRTNSWTGPDECSRPAQFVRCVCRTRWLGSSGEMSATSPQTGAARRLHSSPLEHRPDTDIEINRSPEAKIFKNWREKSTSLG